MDNPKLRIETNGHITEVYIDGKKVDRATMADFRFHAEPNIAEFKYEKFVTDCNGKMLRRNNKPVRENHTLKFD